MEARQWAREVELVREAYPRAGWRELRWGSARTRAWWLRVTPTPDPLDLPWVLADLDRNETVSLGLAGRVSHSPGQCGQPAGEHPTLLAKPALPSTAYLVELVYPPRPEGRAGPTHPRARILMPELSRHTLQNHPHLVIDPSSGTSWACPMPPHATAWTWEPEATVKYLDQVAIWLLKTEVWRATGGNALPSLGRWLGAEAPHHPSVLLREAHPEGPCRCGSGEAYRQCHLGRDATDFLRLRTFQSPNRGQSQSNLGG